MSGSRPLAYRKSEKGGRDRSKVGRSFFWCFALVWSEKVGERVRLTGTGILLIDEADTSAFIFG